MLDRSAGPRTADRRGRKWGRRTNLSGERSPYLCWSLHALVHSRMEVMPHELHLPKLDISPFLDSARPDPALRQQAAADLDHHLTANGFLYLTGFDAIVSQQDLDAVLHVSRAFFARPEAEKAKLRIQRGDGARGEPAAGRARIPILCGPSNALKIDSILPTGWQKMGENVTGGYSDWHEGKYRA